MPDHRKTTGRTEGYSFAAGWPPNEVSLLAQALNTTPESCLDLQGALYVEEPGCNGVQHSVYPLRGLDYDILPSGEPVTIHGTEILRFREGKIVEYWGGPHCMHGIGLSPARGAEGWSERSRNEC